MKKEEIMSKLEAAKKLIKEAQTGAILNYNKMEDQKQYDLAHSCDAALGSLLTARLTAMKIK